MKPALKLLATTALSSIAEAALATESGTNSDDTVILTTSRQPECTVLTLTVKNVKDATVDNVIAADSVIDFKTHVRISVFHLVK